MSFYSKEEYEFKKKYADRVSTQSEDLIIEQLGLSDDSDIEDIQELSTLSHLRHTVHTEGTRFGSDISRYDELINQIYKIKDICIEYQIIDDLSDLIIPQFDRIPSLDDDYDMIMDLTGWNPESYQQDGEWDYDVIVDGVRNLLNDINDYWSDSIRHFFKKINEKYGTNYPDGNNEHYSFHSNLKKFFSSI